MEIRELPPTRFHKKPTIRTIETCFGWRLTQIETLADSFTEGIKKDSQD